MTTNFSNGNLSNGESEAGISTNVWLVGFWIALAICSRFLNLPPNFSFVGGAALFSGAMLPGALAFVVPVVIMLGSDLVLGFHGQMLTVYLSFALVVGLGRYLKSSQLQSSALAVGGSSLLGSLLFFLVSNFGVWTEGVLYPLTLSGLSQCYLAGLPFLKNTMAGDMISSAVIFLGFQLLSRTFISNQSKI